MKIRLKNGDDFVEIDSDFSEEEIEIDKDLDDTLEINTDEIKEGVNENG